MDPTRTLPESASPALASIAAMAGGDLADFHACVAPGAVNRESQAEPPACRVPGPEGFLASALWLRAAFADLRWEVEDVAVSTGTAAVSCRMEGRQQGPFAVHRADGSVEQAFPSRGRTFVVAQTHWFRVADGLVTEHWAVRDDLGLARQLGWVPPSPVYLLRMARARREAHRAALRV